MLIQEYDNLTKDMDLPDCKRYDWAWLLRHMPIRNKEHKNFERAYEFVKERYDDIGENFNKMKMTEGDDA